MAASHEPEDLLCPILHVMYQDPVVTASGNTYERTAIAEFWQRQGQQRDPLTNTVCRHGDLITNWQKRREVEAFLARRPDYIPEGWSDRQQLEPAARCATSQGKAASRDVLIFLGVVVVSMFCGYCLVPRSRAEIGSVVRVASTLEDALREMEQNPKSVDAQFDSCTALSLLLTSDRDVDTFHSLGGIELVLKGMRQHSTAMLVQKCSCMVLSVVSSPLGERSVASVDGIELSMPTQAMRDCQRKLIELGGLDLVLKAMNDHARSVDLQTFGCKTIASLASSPEARRGMESSINVEQLTSAIKDHQRLRLMECASALIALHADIQVKITLIPGSLQNHLMLKRLFRQMSGATNGSALDGYEDLLILGGATNKDFERPDGGSPTRLTSPRHSLCVVVCWNIILMAIRKFGCTEYWASFLVPLVSVGLWVQYVAERSGGSFGAWMCRLIAMGFGGFECLAMVWVHFSGDTAMVCIAAPLQLLTLTILNWICS